MGEHEVRPAKRSGIFLDRDGVLNRAVVRSGRPYPPDSVAQLAIYEDVPSGCARLKDAGFVLVVVTNQPDVGRGKQRQQVVEAINSELARSVPAIDRIEVCFHAGTEFGDPCDCRKPKPGMLHRAANALAIELSTSFMIGDRWQDVDCARAAGCRAVFIDHGYAESLRQAPDVTVSTFAQAVDAVLSCSGGAGLLREGAPP